MELADEPMVQHRIRQRAYELHQTRERGSPIQDWLEAEEEVLDEIAQSTRFSSLDHNSE
jgi:hypothetical protein